MGKDAKAKPQTDIEKVDESPPDFLPSRLAEKIPKEVQREFFAFIAKLGPAPHPLAKVVNEEHLSKIIDSTERNAERGYKFACSNRRFAMAVFVITLAAAAILIYGFRDKPQVFAPILSALAGFAAGFAAGGGALKKG